MTLLNIEKAFNKVWQIGLIYKMIKLNFPTTLIKIIFSYLQNRKLTVNINNETSNTININAGVPQGSVLGPKLFLYFINDVPRFEKMSIALFADDLAIYCHSFSTVVAAKQIEIHLNVILNYYNSFSELTS